MNKPSKNKNNKKIFIIFMSLLVILCLPSCCWNDCLKPCKLHGKQCKQRHEDTPCEVGQNKNTRENS